MKNLADPSLSIRPELLTYVSNPTVTRQHEFEQIQSSSHTTRADELFAEAQEQASLCREFLET